MRMRSSIWMQIGLLAVGGCVAGDASERSSARDIAGAVDDTDRQAIQDALDAVIHAGQSAIADLETQISQLEQSNRAKAAEIDRLVGQIEQRRSELDAEYRRNLVLCLFFPDPTICVLANVISNDGQMRDYNERLSAARAEQSRAQAAITSYQTRRDALRAQIAPLRDSRDRLLAAMDRSETSIPAPAVLDDPTTAAAYTRAETLGSLSSSFHDEIGFLGAIRDAAADLAATLDSALATIQDISEAVDALVKRSRDRFMQLLEALLAGDPEAAARDWLDDELARRTEEIARQLGWPACDIVRHLVDTRADGEVDPDTLTTELLEKLVGGNATCEPDASLVGSFRVGSGASWTTNPVPVTCLEACAALFGGSAGAYSCSTSATFIDHRAWVDGYGDSSHCTEGGAVAETFKQSAHYDCGSLGCSYSAYVSDHGCLAMNYCWAP
jgi:hypothetical protein